MTRPKTDLRFKDSRQRIVAAACSEVAEYGFSGARIDRIARRAQTSKERIYAYFSAKEVLCRAVWDEHRRRIDEAALFDANDIVGYVAALFDYYLANPEHARLSHWIALEGELATSIENPHIQELQTRIEQISRAQAEKLIDAKWDPLTLYSLLTVIATTWISQPRIIQQMGQLEATIHYHSQLRDAVREAARRLVNPPAAPA
jgi:AcrR family transcriptional regulator